MSNFGLFKVIQVDNFSPNYGDIRQTEGFKNASLGNDLTVKTLNEGFPFIRVKSGTSKSDLH